MDGPAGGLVAGQPASLHDDRRLADGGGVVSGQPFVVSDDAVRPVACSGSCVRSKPDPNLSASILPIFEASRRSRG